jgi:hypothetical protein
VKGAFANYFWSSALNRSRTKVFWLQCCQTKGKGGINLGNPPDAMAAMMTKWIMKAIEPGRSNLYLMLKYQLENFQSYSGGRWAPSLEYFMLPKFQAKRESKAWNRIGTSWRSLVKEVQWVKPKIFEEVMNESFWWSEFAVLIGPGFSKSRAAQLHRAGLKRIQDAWEDGSLISVDRAKEKFGLKAGEDRAWLVATDLLTQTWVGMLRGINPVAGRQEWLGIFGEAKNGLPGWSSRLGTRFCSELVPLYRISSFHGTSIYLLYKRSLGPWCKYASW